MDCMPGIGSIVVTVHCTFLACRLGKLSVYTVWIYKIYILQKKKELSTCTSSFLSSIIPYFVCRSSINQMGYIEAHIYNDLQAYIVRSDPLSKGSD